MLAVKGIYDGKQIQLNRPIIVKGPVDVIVTFLGWATAEEDELTSQTMAKVAMDGGSFVWLNHPDEDGIYTDEDGEPV